MVKKQMKKLLMFMVMLIAVFMLGGKSNKVLANDFTTAYNLIADGKWSGDCYLEKNVEDYYKIELSTTGYLNLKLMSYIKTPSYDYTYVKLYDEEFDYLGYSQCNGATSTAPVTNSSGWVLSAGTYYVKISTDDTKYSGYYKLYADFASYGTDITVGGAASDSAKDIYLDKKIKGAVTATNSYDWFKIEVPMNGKYKYIFESYVGLYVTVYDNNLGEISSNDTYWDETINADMELSAGTYYVKVEGKKYDGLYYFELRTIIPEKGQIITHTSTKNQYKVTKAGKTGGTVEYYRGNNGSSTTISIPDTVKIDGITYKVTGISANALEGNQKVKKVVVGKNIKTIGTRAFYGCTELKTVTFQKSSALTTIKSKAFSQCKKLSKITIPEKVTSIGKQAFEKCSKLKSIIIKTTKLKETKVGAKAFSNIYKKATIKVPKSSYNKYKKMLKKKGIGSTVAIRK